jgi:hypothetical protein
LKAEKKAKEKEEKQASQKVPCGLITIPGTLFVSIFVSNEKNLYSKRNEILDLRNQRIRKKMKNHLTQM